MFSTQPFVPYLFFMFNVRVYGMQYWMKIVRTYDDTDSRKTVLPSLHLTAVIQQTNNLRLLLCFATKLSFVHSALVKGIDKDCLVHFLFRIRYSTGATVF